jgi:putative ABC transport system ATP-binding protein
MSIVSTETDPDGRPEPPEHRPLLLSLENVTRTHGAGTAVPVHALRGVSLDVRVGELVAVMGPSGSGKSSLLHAAGGLDVPTSGDVVIDGVSVVGLSIRSRARLRRRSVGYVFQDLNLVPALTAIENVMLPRELDGVRLRQARQEAREALAEVGVADLADRFPDEMSGGQQQRVAIARALVGPRRLVLADEPTGALDTLTGESIMRVLRARVDAGAAGLLVTHDAQHAAWADRVVFLRDGEVVDDGRSISGGGLPAGGVPAASHPASPANSLSDVEEPS